jgi:hypothetical protein
MSTSMEICVSEELQIVEYVLISGTFTSVGRKKTKSYSMKVCMGPGQVAQVMFRLGSGSNDDILNM